MDWKLALHFFIAATAIVNPIGKVPLWIEAAGGETPEVRWRLAALVTLAGTAILLVFLLLGEEILRIFSIDLSSFKVGGVLSSSSPESRCSTGWQSASTMTKQLVAQT